MQIRTEFSRSPAIPPHSMADVWQNEHAPAAFSTSDRGIETSPAVGRIAADLLLDGRTESFDAGLLDPARFAGGAP